MKGFRKNKNKLVKFLFKNIERKYLFEEGYLKNYRTKAYWHHQNKIAELRRKNNNYKKTANTWIRAVVVVGITVLVALLNDFYVPFFVADSDNIFLKITSVGVSGVVMSAPIIFVIWVFRDRNRLMELENARKDTNLKEFQQLQRWATGNIEGDKDNQGNKIALQISALHSLRAYLKGEYGDSFRRGTYEIFRASLATQHQKILKQVNEGDFENITIAINSCQLTKQLNIIASEEWFNLLINHNFPTNNISLLGVNLSKTYLHHCTYGKTLDLGGAQLQKANFFGAQLQGACLNNAQLQGADLREAQLQGANLSNARLQKANFFGARLQEACLNNAQLQGAYLREARLQGANLSNARLQKANFFGAQLQEACLNNAQLQGADLREAQLQGANLNNARLQGANLNNARLQGACLNNARLQGANLREAQLQGANLNNARLQGANLREARLQGANLNNARLQGACLNNARLQGACLNNAQLQGANLREAQLQGANLNNARLQGANLREAQLQGANLNNARLQGACLNNAQLQGANLNNARLQGAHTNVHYVDFKQRIEQQIDQDTTKEIRGLMYKALDDTQKSQLIAGLKAIGSVWATEAIERIKSASETLDLSKANTGKYSQQDADEWLNDYHKAMKKQ